MARSLWKKTLIASLACAGIVCAQEPASSIPGTTKKEEVAERMVTIQESGKPSHRCKGVKSWRPADGTKAYQVRAMDTGETMTIVENGPDRVLEGSQPGTRRHAITMRIFHWGSSLTPPEGCPVPSDQVAKTAKSSHMAVQSVQESSKPDQPST